MNLKSIKQLLFLIPIILLGLAFSGCAKLAKDGPYHGDQVLFEADRAITATFDVLKSFVKWEHENRSLLAGTPEIKRAADKVRLNAKRWRDSAIALRDAYRSDPTAENKQYLEAALDILQTAAVEASAYMTKR